jgi:hypothetical protein
MRFGRVLLAVAALIGAYLLYLRSDAHRNGNRLFYREGRPNALGRAVGRASSFLYGLGIGPSFLVSLETIGRRTGLTRAIPVVLADYGGERHVVSMLGERSPWVGNVRASGGRAVIKHGGRQVVHLAELPVDARGPVIKAFLGRAIDARPHIRVDPDAPLEAFEAVAASVPVFRIEPVSS